ncbi:hypothetical protein D1007_00844 [Hordeum vulgare]|nr:hypothetical protein D1007_00844 [Hordeum vulgare]
MAVEAEAARNRPPPVPHLKTPAGQMAFLVSTVQGMEKNIQEIMQNQKSIERVVETKFHNMDVKDEDEDEDDDDEEDESPPPTTTRFSTKPRSLGVAFTFLTVFLGAFE